MAGGERVDAGAAQGAGAEAGGGQVGAAHPPGPAGLFAEQVAARLPRQGLLPAAQVAVLVKGFHVAAQALLPLALPVPPALPEFVFERVAVAVVAQPAGFPVGEHVRQGGGDQLQGLALAVPALVAQMVGGLLKRRFPLRGQLAETAQQAQVGVKRGVHRVEIAHDLEVLTQGGAPVRQVVARADAVDQRQAGAAGPAQDFHFRFLLAAVRHRAVHHIENAGALQYRRQQLAFVMETGVVAVLGDEGAHRVRPVRRGQAVGLQPGQHPARALEAGGVDQFVQQPVVHAQRVVAVLPGGARLQGDGDAVVLGQGGDNARLALVGVADHGETGQGALAHGRHSLTGRCRSTKRCHWASSAPSTRAV